MGIGEPCTGYWQASASGPVTPCQMPADGLFEAVCDCGHPRRGWLCLICVTAPVLKGRFCLACHDADGHDCPLGPLAPVPLLG
jgi:hypothetical protein